MKKYKKYIKNGFTLVELLIAIALLTAVITVSMNMFFFGTNTHRLTFKEYEIQSDVRIATEQVTNIVRYSKAVFGVPYPFVESTSKMDPGWSYFMVSPDGKQIVSMDYNETTKIHEPTVIVKEQDNIEYKMIFEKDENAKNDNVMIYKIYAQVIDEYGNKIRDKIVFESKVESVNAVQVADKGTVAAPSIALAYRNDGQTSGKGKNEIAYITIIIDVSGSMNANPSGVYPSRGEHKDARIRFVREALAGDGEKEGIIQFFSKEENIYLSLIPFSTTANTPTPTANSKPNEKHTIYEVFNKTHSDDMLAKVNDLKADGGTNTGDALRQAYHLHSDFRTTMEAMSIIKPEDQVHHYMILLVDGQTTYQTKYQKWYDDGKYRRRGWFINYEVWFPEAKYYQSVSDFIGKGNIDPSNMRYSYKYPDTSVPLFPSDGAVYGKKNPDVTIIGLDGDGYNTINNDKATSIQTLGNLIKSFDDGNGIGSYLIGYASGLSGEIKYIGDSIGTPENIIVDPNDPAKNSIYRYLYNDESFDVSKILNDIAKDIMADFWLATGPKIQ